MEIVRIDNLVLNPKSKRKAFRKGRGHGSGNGKTAGRGHKGQNARSGGGVRLGFEGGQMPQFRRVPKRGFKNRNKKLILIINLGLINKLFDDGANINFEILKAKGIFSKEYDGFKVLANGDLDKKFFIKANAFSKSAKEKIEATGGTAEVV